MQMESLIIFCGAHIVDSRRHRYLVEPLGEQLLSLLIGYLGQNHHLGARLWIQSKWVYQYDQISLTPSKKYSRSS